MRKLLLPLVVLGLVACNDDPGPFVLFADTTPDTVRDSGDTGTEIDPDTDEDTGSDVPDVPEPDADVPEPDADVPEPDADVPEPDADVPEPDADVPEPDADVPELDADGSDVEPDADAEPDLGDVPPRCGDGIVDADEECDDGNDINTDECNNACRISYCGDGIINATRGELTVEDPLIDAFSEEGYVCDDGASCSTGPSPTVCDVAENGRASEHGICQAMGFDFAVTATWGGGAGTGIAPMHHAFNWECADFDCIRSPFAHFDADCSTFEMLADITCEGIIGEECDEGDDNADEADACRTTCVLPACGDGIIDSGEECDEADANADVPDACRLSCLNPACGDDIIDSGEECDDGPFNADTADACRTTCVVPACMDGIVDSGEECDDANDVEDDGCSNICRVPGCRDGVLQAGEECDDGNDIPDDGCSNECLLPQCGDGVVNGEEECDDGDDDDTNGCRNDCLLPTCGDGVVSDFLRDEHIEAPIVTGPTGATGHVCDDGGSCFGSTDGTTCDVFDNGSAPEHGICQALGYERCVSVTWGGGPGDSDAEMPHAYNWECIDYVCGPSDSTYDRDNCSSVEMLRSIQCYGGFSEDCDEGDANSDEPGATCRTDCTLPRCGDGVWEEELGEECDDGNDVEDDGCSNLCRLPQCGDGVIQADVGEECDDGNDIDTDDCRNDCTLQICGDGFLADAEECDDAEFNADEPDSSCRTTCLFPTCGDAITDTGEECDDGNTSDRDLCLTSCVLASCGDGIRQAILGEDCDDGDDDDDDECANDCTGDVTGFGACADYDLGSMTGEAVSEGTTAGMGNDYTAGCAASSNGQDLSFNWVAPTDGTYEINTEGSTYDTALAVRGMPDVIEVDECFDSVELACNDDSIYGLRSQILFDAVGGTEYLIIVDGFSSSAGGPYILNIIPPL